MKHKLDHGSDIIRVVESLSINNPIKLTQIAKVGLIRDETDLVAQTMTQSFTSFVVSLFKGLLESIEKVDRSILGSENNIGTRQLEGSDLICSEGITSTLVLPCQSIVPPCLSIFLWLWYLKIFSKD